jgi:SAM-dependent methyltransferase
MDSAHSLVVMTIPRGPFLPHSSAIFRHLCGKLAYPVKQILELGCGPNSPLVPVLKQLFPQAKILQIDALADVVQQARQANPDCQVEHMLAADMSSIASESQDLVVGMSVFDQNPVNALPDIAGEIRRVLKPQGGVAYVHNEEINLPAQAASFAREQNRLLLPSPRWQPTADIEYCAGPRTAIEAAISRSPASYQPLVDYLLGILPQIYATERKTDMGEVRVPFLRGCDPGRMELIRQAVRRLESALQTELEDLPTDRLLHDHLVRGLFSQAHGFNTEIAHLFEQRSVAHWRDFFSQAPPTSTFVRGCTRFGYTCDGLPPSRTDAVPLEEPWPDATQGQLTLIGYQFGLWARKVDNP